MHRNVYEFLRTNLSSEKAGSRAVRLQSRVEAMTSLRQCSFLIALALALWPKGSLVIQPRAASSLFRREAIADEAQIVGFDSGLRRTLEFQRGEKIEGKKRWL